MVNDINMKAIRSIFASLSICVACLESCNVEEAAPLPQTEHRFCINSSMPTLETVSDDETKASLQPKISLKWDNNDAISVINMTTGKVLGKKLFALVIDEKVSFKGSLVGSVASGDKLVAVYPAMENESEVDFTRYEIDFSAQKGTRDEMEFCAYSSFVCPPSGDIDVNTDFSVPVSFVQVGLSNIQSSSAISSVTFGRVGNKVQFVNNGGSFSVSNSRGEIVLKPESLSTNADGNAFVYFTAAPSTSYLPRTISILSKPYVFSGNWVKADMVESKYYTTISSKFSRSDAPTFSITPPTTLYVSENENDLVFTVNSSVDWTVTGDSKLEITPASGSVCENQDVVVKIPANPTSDIIVYGLEFSTATESVQYSISQTFHAENGDYVDEYGINYGQGINIDGVIWAPVNCGYKPASEISKGFIYGKLYQWGRKNGVGYEEGPLEDEIVPNISDFWNGENGEEDPNTFYTAWCNGGVGNEIHGFLGTWCKNLDLSYWNLGTEQHPVKNTRYDPCPEGWRVPTYSELVSAYTNYTDNQKLDGIKGDFLSGETPFGQAGDNKIFVPYAGTRSSEGDGSLIFFPSRGNVANLWSSYCTVDWNAPSPQPRIYMIGSGSFSSLKEAASANSVRCVKEDSHAPNLLDIEPPASLNVSSEACDLTFKIDAGPFIKGWKIEVSDPNVRSSITNGKPGIGQNLVISLPENRNSSKTEIEVKFTWGKKENSSGITYDAFTEIYTIEQAGAPRPVIDYVDAQDHNHGRGIKINGVVWAPVSCHNGNVFQWGRKYGQDIHSDETQYSTATWKGKNGEENPNVMYGIEHGTGYWQGVCVDWIEDGSNTFWNSGTEAYPVKNTKYDPCPSGWRVPTRIDFLSLMNATFVNDEDEGYYYFWNGDNSNVLRQDGDLWTSSYDRNDQKYIYHFVVTIYAGIDDSVKPHLRADSGRSSFHLIRCVQE